MPCMRLFIILNFRHELQLSILKSSKNCCGHTGLYFAFKLQSGYYPLNKARKYTEPRALRIYS